jgi:hypothetical protein
MHGSTRACGVAERQMAQTLNLRNAPTPATRRKALICGAFTLIMPTLHRYRSHMHTCSVQVCNRPVFASPLGHHSWWISIGTGELSRDAAPDEALVTYSARSGGVAVRMGAPGRRQSNGAIRSPTAPLLSH